MKLNVIGLYLLFATFIGISMSHDSTTFENEDTGEDRPLKGGETLLMLNVSMILSSLLDDYDQGLRPNYGDKKVVVNISMYIYSMGDVSETAMEYTIDLYFRQQWSDPRLSFDDNIKIEDLALTNEMVRKLWVPDTYFINERRSNYHTVLSENSLIRIKPNGNLLYSTRLTITPSCQMDLKYFPMDMQHCMLWMESYAYSDRDIEYNWVDTDGITMDQNISLPQFSLLGFNHRAHKATYYVGNYSQLVADFYLGRSISYYVIQVYVPASMIVLLSWVSFWINRAATPARVALGITTVLTLTTLMASVNSSLPKLSYVKAIDYYLVMCYLFVFAALIEFALVSYTGSLADQKKRNNPSFTKIVQSASCDDDNDIGNEKDRALRIINSNDVKINAGNDWGNDNKYLPSQEESGVWNYLTTFMDTTIDADRVDRVSRVLFPFMFMCFQILYWVYYMTVTNVDVQALVR
ncbi:gamma-aminobutyric acid receptor subunit beta-like [Antedon mediterranea]|uniref:gamma-aminobutyric acid receptor subunit beta-like n=1 Tax=Antedon mediterranea TaxID=105859 RepID=UPI003AF48142